MSSCPDLESVALVVRKRQLHQPAAAIPAQEEKGVEVEVKEKEVNEGAEKERGIPNEGS
jgi:hypothetical protein